MARKSFLRFAAALFALATSPAFAQQLSEAEQKIRAALDRPTVMEFIETPLSDVVAFMSDYHNMPIVIDTKALDDVGLGTDTPVTKNLRGISLRAGLKLMLRELELTWLIADEVLQITTPEEAKTRTAVRTYNISDLAPHNSVAETLAESIAFILRQHKQVGRGKTFSSASGAPAQQTTVKSDQATVKTLDDRGSARISIFGSMLLVRGTEEQHYEVEQLLKQMRGSLLKSNFATYVELASNATPRRQRPTSSKPIKTEWGVGKRVRYAIVGFIDFDGDGRSDRAALRSLIQTTEGIIDAEVFNDGVCSGDVSIHTHYVLVGQRPDANSNPPEVLRGYAKFIERSDKLGIDKVSAEKIFRKLQDHTPQNQARRQSVENRKKQNANPSGVDPFGGADAANDPFGGGASSKQKDSTREDQQIAIKLARQLQTQEENGNLKECAIEFEVVNQVVTLKGSVLKEQQRTIALDLARRIPNVVKVVNQITIKNVAKFNDLFGSPPNDASSDPFGAPTPNPRPADPFGAFPEVPKIVPPINVEDPFGGEGVGADPLTDPKK